MDAMGFVLPIEIARLEGWILLFAALSNQSLKRGQGLGPTVRMEKKELSRVKTPFFLLNWGLKEFDFLWYLT